MNLKEDSEDDEVDLVDLCYRMYSESLFALVIGVAGLVLGLSLVLWWALA